MLIFNHAIKDATNHNGMKIAKGLALLKTAKYVPEKYRTSRLSSPDIFI